MSSDVETEGSDNDSVIDFDDLWFFAGDLAKRQIQPLGLSKNYSPSWGGVDAFREFYQNWRDALISSFDLDSRTFKPMTKETPACITITVYADADDDDDNGAGDGRAKKQLLGYIKFAKNTGLLEMTNLKARLAPSMLSLGATDKQHNESLAGCHGEGFKLAALVMCRNGHSVQYTTCSQYWRFRFQGTGPSALLRCHLSPAKPDLVARKKAEYIKKTRSKRYERGLTSNLWEDVRVRIGTGKGAEGRQISLPEFRTWLKIAIDLDGPNPDLVVQTSQGDLIVDEKFSGRIYLKGLRVDGHSRDDQNYVFGYNFVRGRINRDRDLLASRNEEGQMLARIWEEAIHQKGDAFADRYISLFQTNKDTQLVPDIYLAEKYSSPGTVQALWARLRSCHPRVFFYSEKKSSGPTMITEEDIITNDLKMIPKMLNKKLWRMLRNHALVRSPYEERAHRFSSSPITLSTDDFAINVTRGLRGSFQLSPKLKPIRIEFVKAGGTDIALMFMSDENLLQVHEKWLDFERIHMNSECEYYQLTHDHSIEEPVFMCDHVVEELLETALEEIRGPLGMNQAECVALRSKAAKRVRQMPRMIDVSASDGCHQLSVSWVGTQSTVLSRIYDADIVHQVVLHSVKTCANKRAEVVDLEESNTLQGQIDVGERQHARQVCSCPRQVVPRSMSRATFDNLDTTNSYFPLVSRVGAYSFFGLPPEPISPVESRSDVDTVMSSEPASNFTNCEPEASPDDEGDTAASSTIQIGSTTHGSVQMPLRQTSSQTSHRTPRSRTVDTAESRKLLQRDEESWRDWHSEKLPLLFSQLMPYGQALFPEMVTATPSTEWEPLELTFLDEYVHVVINDRECSEYIIFIHDFRMNNEEFERGRRYVLATMYSPLLRTYPFEGLAGSDDYRLHEKELVLRFRDFDNMAKREDAEWLPLDMIKTAQRLEVDSGEVEHVVEVPKDEDIQGYFCRFAIRSVVTASEDVACVTPVCSNLLPTKHRWRRPKFASSSTPLVLELSPGVLGPAEGFAQAGFPISTALSFDESRHLTWKMRHPSSAVYDGSTAEVIADFDSSSLQWLQLPRQKPPQVVLLASGKRYFRHAENNKQMPSLHEFLRPIQVLDEATDHFRGDFIVALLAPAMLHPSAVDKLSSSILRLLEKRMSVHLKLTPLKEHHLPQDRSVLTMIASPYCAELPWNACDMPTEARSPTSTSMEDVIGDLNFVNPRTPSHTRSGFVCRCPNLMVDNHVYNHYTGQHLAPGHEAILVDADTMLSISGFDGCQPWIHSVRRDRLTVRELARIQGFPDDFVLYGSMSEQYDDICRAIPPAVTKKVAQVIWQLIEGLGPVKTEGPDPPRSTRGYKRPRVDSVDEE